ncbi:hypothetical protein V6Z12_D02G246800 [Gossypium hirsutum]
MEILTYNTISFLFLYFFVSVLCQNGSDISPISSPSPFGVSTQQLIFKDRRLAVVYPVIQAFKATITEDPLNRTGNWVGGAPTLEGFIDKLPDLAIFHANSNKFAGSIPDVSQLKYFYELDVSNNVHAGTFPMTVIGVKDLSFLDIRFNLFSGSVPPEIFNQALEVLFINNNDFTAKLPENFGSTPVRYLTLANNKLTGSIPRGIGNLNMTLIEVLLLNNKLTGCLPYEVGFLKELKLFDVEDNLLTGPLPCSLSCLDKIELLNLANNLFYWEVPEELCALVNLENLTLSGNYFTKVGPACRKLIKNGILDMTQNCVPDLPHQRSLLECTEFYLKYIRFCPYPETYKIIPCKDGYHHHWEGSKAKTMKAPVTYKTLSRHKF